MDNLKLSFYDGKNRIHIGPVTRLDQLQGDNFNKIIKFFAESESGHFTMYVEHKRKTLLEITIRRFIGIDELMKLFCLLYANNKPTNDGKEF